MSVCVFRGRGSKEGRVMREWRVIEEVRMEAEGVKIPADFKSSQVYTFHGKELYESPKLLWGW